MHDSELGPTDSQPARVLVVEDEWAVRRELCELLAEEGYSVVAAANGRDALTAIDGGLDFSVVLLDLMMPVMDGWQFLEQLRARHRDVPVVVATASEADAPPRGVPILHKPFSIEPLLNLLAEQRA